ncbi:MAG: hypothetical protein KBG20_14795 [Caldilineaceae bacterium]|nr:hypothetical protein [Caldilineaceae bacterium]MBP8107473.1 hypothetical protein [Caldilineaceae bacterium]MBP8122378.1 hypothetical protein [Caldilineaceae bacterium]MBP9073572.1 hypothetical protein [Caldilineaceae bacterium]
MKHILLYGSSIFLAGLAATLQADPSLDIHQQAPSDGLLDLGDLDAVIVDFGDAPPAHVLTMLRARPDLKMVGVNASDGAVTVLSGRVYMAQTLTDVLRCLEQKAK